MTTTTNLYVATFQAPNGQPKGWYWRLEGSEGASADNGPYPNRRSAAAAGGYAKRHFRRELDAPKAMTEREALIIALEYTRYSIEGDDSDPINWAIDHIHNVVDGRPDDREAEALRILTRMAKANKARKIAYRS